MDVFELYLYYVHAFLVILHVLLLLYPMINAAKAVNDAAAGDSDARRIGKFFR